MREQPNAMKRTESLMTTMIGVDGDRLPYCPMVRITRRFGPLVVNPKITNTERLELVSRALFGDRWKWPAATAIGVHRDTVAKWAFETAPPDEAIQRLIDAARARIRKLELAIEQARMPPWIK